eukprot:896496-Rhodomonas_salina.1
MASLGVPRSAITGTIVAYGAMPRAVLTRCTACLYASCGTDTLFTARLYQALLPSKECRTLNQLIAEAIRELPWGGKQSVTVGDGVGSERD